jgi:Zn-dependent protease with chaperone function
MALITDPRLRRFAWAMYFLGAMLILIPLLDTAAGIFPPQPNRGFWRYGSAGVLSRGLLDPALGVVIVSVTAVAMGHERLRKTILVVLVLAMVALIAGLGVFALDALQVRASVTQQMRVGFVVATGLAMLRYLMLFALFWLLTRALRAPRASRSVTESVARGDRSVQLWGKKPEGKPTS